MDCIYIKDPIGKIYYSDPSEIHLFRENAGQSAFEYIKKVKREFTNSFNQIMNGNYNIPGTKDNEIDFVRFIEDKRVDDPEISSPSSRR